MKKGISPLIATVFIIAMVVVIASLIFIFGKNYIDKSSQKSDIQAEEALMCTRDINFQILSVCYLNPSTLRIKIANNAPEKDIRKLNIRYYTPETASDAEEKEVILRSSIRVINFMVPSPDITKIEMIPTVRHKFRSITCGSYVASYTSSFDPCV